jgi:signal transduction histidine kinase
MRKRLTAAFLLMTLAVVGIFALVRLFTLEGLVRAQESENLDRQAALIGALVSQRKASDQPIDEAYLELLVDKEQQVEVTLDGQSYVAGSLGDSPPESGDLVAHASDGEIVVTMRESGAVVAHRVRSNTPPLAVTALVLIMLAGAAGYRLSGAMARPFQELADAAAALGRGRFDLALPTYSVPEAEGIARALRGSAHQIEASMKRDRTFVQHASHVLRTPLTGLRLELDDLAQRTDVSADVREAAERCVAKVERLDTEIDGLIMMAREAGTAPGAEVTLEHLARQIAQQWTDSLAEHGRDLRATVDGEITLSVTPGPGEQLLDHALADVVARGSGRATQAFEGTTDQHRLRVKGGGTQGGGPGGGPGSPLADRDLVEGLGGQISGDALSPEGLQILLPRR